MFRFAVFNTNVEFVIGEKKFKNFCKRFDIPQQTLNKRAEASTWSFAREGKPLLVCVVYHPRDEKEPSSRKITCLLAHEAMHVVQDMVDNIGERNCGKEVEAYTLQMVLNFLIREYEQTKKVDYGQ